MGNTETQKTFKAKYIKTVPSFNTGLLVSANTYRKVGYWKSEDVVRKTRDKTYLVIAGSDYYGNSLGYAEHVFEVIDPTKSLSIKGLEFNDLDRMPFPGKGEVVDITFSSEPPNY